jgi:hypothetical protein
MATKYDRTLDKLEAQMIRGSLFRAFICPVPTKYRNEACGEGECECAREREAYMQATRWKGQFVVIDREMADL